MRGEVVCAVSRWAWYAFAHEMTALQHKLDKAHTVADLARAAHGSWAFMF